MHSRFLVMHLQGGFVANAMFQEHELQVLLLKVVCDADRHVDIVDVVVVTVPPSPNSRSCSGRLGPDLQQTWCTSQFA